MITLLIINTVIDVFGFTLAPVIIIKLILCSNLVNNNNGDNIKPFKKYFITADENQIHV